MSKGSFLSDLHQPAYPTVRQAWAIFAVLIAAQIVSAPIQLVLGKENGIGLFLMYSVAMAIGLAYALWQKSQVHTASLEYQPLIESRPTEIQIYALCILAIPCMVLVSAPIANLIPVPDFFMEQLESALGGELGVFHFLTIVVAAAFFEEIIFRGIILDGFLRRYTPKKAILYSAFLFALMHMNPLQFPHTFLLGVFVGWVYFRTKSIWPCIWIHFINNGIVFSMALLSGSVDIAEANVEGPGPWSMLAVIPIGVIMLYGVILLLDQNLPNRPIWIQSSEEE